MALQYSYDAVGVSVREELDGMLHICSAEDTPNLAFLPHEGVGNWQYDWLTENVARATSVASEEEGEIATPAVRVPSRLRNIAMILTDTVYVTRTARIVNEAAFADPYDWQVGIKSLELLVQAEVNLIYSTYQAGSSGATARQTAGLLEWAFVTGHARNNGSTATIAGQTVPTTYNAHAFIRDSGATSTLSRTDLMKEILQPTYQLGNQLSRNIMFCGGNVKRALSDMVVVYGGGGTPTYSRNEDAASKAHVTAIDAFDTDFGRIAVALHRDLNSSFTFTMNAPDTSSSVGSEDIGGGRLLYGYDPSYVSVAVLDTLHHEPLGKTKDADQGFVVMEFGLKVKNPRALFAAGNIVA